jgi:hypothetical protein
VIVSQLPVTRCEICHRTVAYRPGRLSEILTEHYRRAHPEVLGVPSQVALRRLPHYPAGTVTGVDFPQATLREPGGRAPAARVTECGHLPEEPAHRTDMLGRPTVR